MPKDRFKAKSLRDRLRNEKQANEDLGRHLDAVDSARRSRDRSPKPAPPKETMKEYLARGGQIKKLTPGVGRLYYPHYRVRAERR